MIRSGVLLDTCPYPLLLVRVLQLDIVIGALEEGFDRLIRELPPDPCRYPNDQTPWWDLQPLRDEARSPDDRGLTDHRHVQADRLHPDQGPAPDQTTHEDRSMAHRHILAHDHT